MPRSGCCSMCPSVDSNRTATLALIDELPNATLPNLPDLDTGPVDTFGLTGNMSHRCGIWLVWPVYARLRSSGTNTDGESLETLDEYPLFFTRAPPPACLRFSQVRSTRPGHTMGDADHAQSSSSRSQPSRNRPWVTWAKALWCPRTLSWLSFV